MTGSIKTDSTTDLVLERVAHLRAALVWTSALDQLVEYMKTVQPTARAYHVSDAGFLW